MLWGILATSIDDIHTWSHTYIYIYVYVCIYILYARILEEKTTTTFVYTYYTLCTYTYTIIYKCSNWSGVVVHWQVVLQSFSWFIAETVQVDRIFIYLNLAAGEVTWTQHSRLGDQLGTRWRNETTWKSGIELIEPYWTSKNEGYRPDLGSHWMKLVHRFGDTVDRSNRRLETPLNRPKLSKSLGSGTLASDSIQTSLSHHGSWEESFTFQMLVEWKLVGNSEVEVGQAPWDTLGGPRFLIRVWDG